MMLYIIGFSSFSIYISHIEKFRDWLTVCLKTLRGKCSSKSSKRIHCARMTFGVCQRVTIWLHKRNIHQFQSHDKWNVIKTCFYHTRCCLSCTSS